MDCFIDGSFHVFLHRDADHLTIRTTSIPKPRPSPRV
jgi:hypothetical protein